MSGGAPTDPTKSPAALTTALLQRLVAADQLRAGLQIYDGTLVLNPSRSGLRLYAEVKGSGQTPYKVTIDFADGKAELEKAKCTCPAARFQGQAVCKHAAATLVAWSSAPQSFVIVAEPAPEGAAGPGGKRAPKAKVKTGSADLEEQAGKGLAALEALVAELASTGLSTLTADRARQVRELSENLRPYRLRRLAPECMRFASTLERAAARDPTFTAEEFAEELASLTFQVRALRKLLTRTDTDAEDYKRLADELLGRTWSAKQLTSTGAMRFLDLGFSKWTTEDGFLIEQSLLADVATGELFVDKVIRPTSIAKRQPAKEDFQRHVVEVAEASIYPGYAPRRVKMLDPKKRGAGPEDWALFLSKVPQSAAELHTVFQAYASDVFAPRPRPSIMKASSIVAARGKVFAVDASMKGIELRLSDEAALALEGALEKGGVLAVAGDLDAGAGGLVMVPSSIIVGTDRAAAVVDLPP